MSQAEQMLRRNLWDGEPAAASRLLDTTQRMPHLSRTFFQRPDRLADPLYVVCPIFNAVRWRSRWRLYQDFEKRVAEAGAILYTIEAAFGERDFAVTDAGNPRHIQLRTSHELWLKENLINLAVARLPLDWKYVAWIDADVTFVRDDWANETLHLLQHYALIQMWSQYQDLTPEHELIGTSSSFVECYLNPDARNHFHQRDDCYYYGPPRKGYPGAPGLAWAARREAWDALGGLFDAAILGACDWYMAHALIGQVDLVLNPAYSDGFKTLIKEWEARATRSIRRNIGVMKGLALHHWHGPKKDRKYGTRDRLLVETAFDPHYDLKRDWQGLYQVAGRSIELRDGLREYFRQRNEDAI